MDYIVNRSDPTQPSVTIPEGSVNVTDTSLSLIGRNYPNYGQTFASNFLHLLENFSSPTSPNNPTTGQLWYDSGNSVLNYFDGLKWNPIVSLNTDSITSLPNTNSVSQNALMPVSDNGQAYNITKSNFLSDVVTPQPGMILSWPAADISPPGGWLFCNGASYYRYSYPDLHNIIGEKFGSAATDYFNVPNLTETLFASNTSTALTYIIKT
jgi:hypothetical protein